MTKPQLINAMGKLLSKMPMEKIQSLYSMTKAMEKGHDFWLALGDEEKSEILAGLDDINNGRVLTLKESREKYINLLKRKK
jgi:hypothetical protein